MEHLLERHLDEAGEVEQMDADFMDSLTEIVRDRIVAERQLAYWKQDLIATEQAIQRGINGFRGIALLNERKVEGGREVARLELVVAKLRLKDEFEVLKKTWRLHEEGVRKIWARQDEIEKEMTAIDDRLREVRKAVAR